MTDAPFFRRIPFRVAFGIVVPLAAAGLAVFLRSPDSLGQRILVCPTHQLTGLYCPGCGTTRMVHALLHLRILDAFDHNPLIFLLSPLIGYVLLGGYLHLVLARPVLPEIRLHPWAAVLVGVALLVFAVARNLPFFPFTVLAP